MASLTNLRPQLSLLSLPNELLLIIAEFVFTTQVEHNPLNCLRKGCLHTKNYLILCTPYRHVSAFLRVNSRLHHLLASWIMQKAVSPQLVVNKPVPKWSYVYNRTVRRRSILHWAVSHGDIQLVQKVLSYGGSWLINQPDDYDATPLFTAVLNGDAAMVSLLLREKANTEVICMDTPGFKTLSPLACSILCGHTEISRLLLQNGADPSGKSDRNSPITNLHIATIIRDHVALQMLLKAGARHLKWHGYLALEIALTLNHLDHLAAWRELEGGIEIAQMLDKTEKHGYVVDPFRAVVVSMMQDVITGFRTRVKDHKTVTSHSDCARCRRLGRVTAKLESIGHSSLVAEL